MTPRESPELHLSHLALERAALGAPMLPADAAHIARCAGCAAGLASLRDERAGVLPSWARALDEAAPSPRRAWRTPAFAWPAFAAAAGIALVLFLPSDRRSAPPPTGELHSAMPYVGAKGSPAIAVHVRRGGVTRRWNGSDALRPGDRIRLEVAGAGFARVSVFAVGDGRDEARPRRLFEGALPKSGALLLPKAWRLDDAPGPERLVVVLTAQPEAEGALAGWVRGEPAAAGASIHRLSIPKVSATPPNGGALP